LIGREIGTMMKKRKKTILRRIHHLERKLEAKARRL
jgi:hypothetical protein